MLITVVILTFIQFYNEFLEALIIYLKPARDGLAVGIRALNDAAYATTIIFATGNVGAARDPLLRRSCFRRGPPPLTGFGGQSLICENTKGHERGRYCSFVTFVDRPSSG